MVVFQLMNREKKRVKNRQEDQEGRSKPLIDYGDPNVSSGPGRIVDTRKVLW